MNLKEYSDNFLVSPCGRLFSKKTNRELKCHDNGRGYLTYKTKTKDGTVRVRLHVAVAECFVENKYNKPLVNHKDGNKKNNHYTNLEWCTISENTKHAWDNKLIVRNKK